MKTRELAFDQQLIIIINIIIIIIIVICLQCVTDHEALTISASSTTTTPPSMAKLGCDDHCGNISIPYPFGIGKRCYHNEWFSINCDNSSHPPKPFLNHSKLDMEVLRIEIDIYRKSVTVNSPIPSNSCGNGSDQQNTAGSSSGTGNWRSLDLRGSPFLYSPDNDLMAVGCVNVLLSDGDGESTASCTSSCNENIIANDCSFGINYCSTRVGEPLDFYTLNSTAVFSGSCTYAFLAYNYTSSYNNISEIINAIGGDDKYAPLEPYCLFPEPLNSNGCFDDTFYTSGRNYSNYYCYRSFIEEGNPYLPNR